MVRILAVDPELVILMSQSGNHAVPTRTILAFLGVLIISGVSVSVIQINHPLVALLFGLAYTVLSNGIVYLLGSFRAFQLPSSYYVIRPCERHGEIYRPFGVLAARTILRSVGAVRFSGRRSDIEELENELIFTEKNHFVCLTQSVCLSVYSIAQGLWVIAGSLLIFNLLFNFYPVISLRHSRAKLKVVRRRIDARLQPAPGR